MFIEYANATNVTNASFRREWITITSDKPIDYIPDPALSNAEPISVNRLVNNTESGIRFKNVEDAEKARAFLDYLDASWEEMMRGAPEDEEGFRRWNEERFEAWSKKVIPELEKMQDR